MSVAESRREIAERVAYKYLDRTFGSRKLANDIEAALKERDERAARAVCNPCRRPEDYHAAERDPEYGDQRHKRIGFEDDWNETCKAAAIRNEDTNAD